MGVRLVITIFFICKIIATVNGLETGDNCTCGESGPGVCKQINQCRQVLSDIKARKPFFDCKPGSNPKIVCCPDPNASTSPPPLNVSETKGRLSELKCQEYSEYVFKNVTIPVLFAGGEPLIKRVSQCAFAFTTLIGGPALPRIKEFPHMARIGYGPDNDIKYSCGGTVISRRYILTAAHCVTQKEFGNPTFVRVGDSVFEDDSDDARPVTMKVASVIVNPDYSPQLQYHDIALLRLTENIVFNNYVRPACLNTNPQYSQTKAIATGWADGEKRDGISSKRLHKEILNFFTFKECSPKHAGNPKTPQGLHENQHFCAGKRNDTRNDCVDIESGGPIQDYHEIFCMYKIIGVSSSDKVCGNAGAPAVYIRVSNYIDWIESIAFSDG